MEYIGLRQSHDYATRMIRGSSQPTVSLRCVLLLVTEQALDLAAPSTRAGRRCIILVEDVGVGLFRA